MARNPESPVVAECAGKNFKTEWPEAARYQLLQPEPEISHCARARRCYCAASKRPTLIGSFLWWLVSLQGDLKKCAHICAHVPMQ